MTYFKHESAYVDDGCEIGEGTKIWHFCHVQKGARIGRNCVFGQNVNVAGDVVIGNGVKVQNNVSIYTGTVIEDFVFLGPSCVLTNVTNPRSEVNRHSLYERTLIRRGASIGANATIVCGMTVGRYAFVAAGAVVAKDVPDYALMVGVPGRRVGWISRHGLPLKTPDVSGVYVCPESGLRYREIEPGTLRCVDLDEEATLPETMRRGRSTTTTSSTAAARHDGPKSIVTKNFAVIGVAGYVAPRHLRAIRETGNRLVAAVDPHDSVRILDRYSYEIRYFREIERFDRHLDKLRRGPEESRIHWVSVCSPNYLHDSHIRIFSEGFTELHTEVYRRTLAGSGFSIAEARPSVEFVHSIRAARK